MKSQNETNTLGLKPFTVIGQHASTGEIFSHHVQAKSGLNAFAVVAQSNSDAEFVAALPGHLSEENDGLIFPGESVVDAGTVLDQPDVFDTVDDEDGPGDQHTNNLSA